MLPQHVLSTKTIPAPFLHPDDADLLPLVDYEYGGVEIRDPSQGLHVRIWTFGYDGANVFVQKDTGAILSLFAMAGVTELSGTFDQNMNPTVAFIAAGVPQLWWFDTTVNMQVFTTYTGITSPKVALDDKRDLETLAGSSDVIFAYLKNGFLYFRAQRDRYTIEYQLSAIPSDAVFQRMGMNSVNRFQFQFFQAGSTPSL